MSLKKRPLAADWLARMHRSQSFSFMALREIAMALERARRELSNGTLISPQLPREE